MDSDSKSAAQRQCLDWCQAEHRTDAVAGDDVHWAEVKSFLAIERILDANAEPEDSEQALSIDVGIERSGGSVHTYVGIIVNDGRERSLLITPSSARQLARALARAADLADQ